MKFELEVIAEDLLPAVRSIIASRLHQQYGLTQEEIAARLGVTQPAVSQYLNRSRADQEVVETLVEDPQTDVLLDDATSRAASNEDFVEQVAQTIETSRDKGLFGDRFEDTSRL